MCLLVPARSSIQCQHNRWLWYDQNTELNCNSTIHCDKRHWMFVPTNFHTHGLVMCLLVQERSSIQCKYNRWLWYDQNTELDGYSALHCNKDTGCVCQSTSIHLVWSCVYCCRNNHRYSAKYNRWLWYDQNTELNGYSAVHCNKDTGRLCQSTSIHLVWSCVYWCRNDHRYSASTTGGCDTIRTLNLTVTPLFTVTRTLDVCANQLPYTWFGHVFTGAGTIIDTVPSTTGGCDTIRTLTLTVTPLFTVTRTLDVCANQLPYTWFGHVFTGARTIIDTVQSTTGGCDTIRTLNLTVTPFFTVTRTLDVCANQLPYTWFGHVFTAAGTMIDTVKRQPVVVIRSEHWTWR